VDRRARAAGRRAAAPAVAGRALAAPAEPPGLRSALGSDPGLRPRAEPALGAGFTELLRGAGVDAALGARDALLRAARVHPSHHGRRLRALPEAAIRPDRVGVRLGTRTDAPNGHDVSLVEGRGDRRDRCLEGPGAEGAAQLLRQAQLLVRLQLPDGPRERGPGDRGQGQDPLGQRLPALRGQLPLLPGEHATGLLGGPGARGPHDARRKRREALRLRPGGRGAA
jgi:hypothetical protein